MKFPQTVLRATGVVRWGMLFCIMSAFSGHCGEFTLESVGVRGGFGANNRSHDFNSAEATLNANLPWKWDLGRSWSVQTRLDFSAGWLGARADNAATFAAGPGFLLRYAPVPVSLEAGICPTLLTRTDIGGKDLGIPLQFTSHLGVNWDFLSHWRVGYRFQHMSNGGLDSKNVGLNMNAFSLSYLF